MSSNPRSPSRSSTSSTSSTLSNPNPKNLATKNKPLNGIAPNGTAPNGPAPNGPAPNGTTIKSEQSKTHTTDSPQDIFHPVVKDDCFSTIKLLPCARVFFTGYANASYKQKITITCNDVTLGVFEGNGENKPMKVTSGLRKDAEGDLVVELPPSFELRECRVKFEHCDSHGEFKGSKTLNPVTVGDGIITTISINSTEELRGDDFCDSQLKCDMMFPDQNNPTKILIPANHVASISCMANAGLKQRVYCKIDDESEPFVFSGNGQNAAMVATRHNKKRTYVTLLPKPHDRYLIGIFTFVDNLAKPKMARVDVQVPLSGRDYKAVTVSTEDTVGSKDKNDTVLRVVAIRSAVHTDLSDL